MSFELTFFAIDKPTRLSARFVALDLELAYIIRSLIFAPEGQVYMKMIADDSVEPDGSVKVYL